MTETRTALVTGAAGFIGYFTCLRLLKDGFRVIGIDSLSDYYDPELKRRRPQALAMRLAAPRGKAVAKVGARNRPESAGKRSSGRCGTLPKHSTHAICERQHQN